MHVFGRGFRGPPTRSFKKMFCKKIFNWITIICVYRKLEN